MRRDRLRLTLGADACVTKVVFYSNCQSVRATGTRTYEVEVVVAVSVISFEQAMRETANSKRHLLLGNGFSISLFRDRFSYRSLLEEADFSTASEVRHAFDLLNTTDFELVIHALRQAVALLPLYTSDADVAARMSSHANLLKELLVQAIAGRHPARPSEVSEAQYASCRTFLANFVGESRIVAVGGKTKDLRGNIYTLNYDLLLYWVLLHEDFPTLAAHGSDSLAGSELLEHDDGFRAPQDDLDAPYVTWEAEGAADGQNIHFLHGGLHLYDYGAELQKKCWERSGGVPLIDQIREALSEDKFPLFVSEGSSDGKLDRIRHSGYLLRSLKSFASVCRIQSASIFVFGHSLADNDAHVLRHIARGRIGNLYVSLYGDPTTSANADIIRRVRRLADIRHERFPLAVSFFDAVGAHVWS